ncbi:hypothetical protein Barb7_02031 [Bacteroidales bacterium Barb7]|nr:hypothetical protein Barb7_02031 [Bacteroidales bacterium Barb7]
MPLTAIPYNPYSFVGWKTGSSDFSDNPHKFIVEDDLVIQANFAVVVNSYQVHLSAENGMIASGNGTYEVGAEVRAEARTTIEGFHFVKWNDENGKIVSDENPYSFTVKENVTLTALFDKKYHVTLLPPQNGTIVSGDGIYEFMAHVTAKAITDNESKYSFMGWTDLRGNIVSRENPYEFFLSKDMAMTANFVLSKYKVSLSAENGTITSAKGDSIYIYEYGTEVTAEAGTDEEKYHFVKWTEDGDSIWPKNSYTFTVFKDRTIQAHFAINRYQMNLSAVNGTITSGQGTCEYGAGVRAEAKADKEEYYFVNWTDTTTGKTVSTENPYRFTAKKNMTIQANFAIKMYEVGLFAVNGTIKSGDGSYLYGEKVEVEAETDKKGYYFVNWTDTTGHTVSTDNPYMITVIEDMKIQAYFDNRYQVNLSAKNGTIKSGDSTCLYGEKVKVEADTDKEGYRFVKWTDTTGYTVSTDNPYTFTVTKDTMLQAHFDNRYQVDLSAKNGTIKSDSTSYAYKAEAKIEAVADTGYHFVQWTNARGDSLSTDNPYTFVVTGDTAIQAHFATNNYRVHLSAKNGRVEELNKDVYAYNTEVEVEAAEADYGYRFAGWMNAAGDSLSADNPYKFVVKGETDLTAVFIGGEYFITVDATQGGKATGGGSYDYGTQVEIKAVPDSGYVFIRWMTGDSLNLLFSDSSKLNFTLSWNTFTSYRAYFVEEGKVNGEIVSGGEARAYHAKDVLHLVHLEGSVISVHTIDGRQILQFKASNTEYPAVLPAGIYILNAAKGKGRYVTKFVVR